MRTDVPNHCYLLAGTHFLASLAPSALTTDRPEKPRSQHQFFPPRGARSGHLGLLVRGIQGSANSHGAIGVPPGDVLTSPFQNIAETDEITTFLTPVINITTTLTSWPPLGAPWPLSSGHLAVPPAAPWTVQLCEPNVPTLCRQCSVQLVC